MPPILLVPIAPVHRELIPPLATSLSTAFQSSVETTPGNGFDPSFAFDFGRNQYNSTAVISAALERFRDASGKILCVTDVDLFVPVLTFVFGEAQLQGTVAVVSTFRLNETLYGLPENPRLLEERLIKESVHELGHTFGLIHCRDYNCVMHSSTSVEEIDVKGVEFCEACKKRMAN